MKSLERESLTITREQLARAAAGAGITGDQTEQIWQTLAGASTNARSGGAQIAWYFGAAISLLAMTWLAGSVVAAYGAAALLALSLIYGGIFGFAALKLDGQPGLRVPSGLLYSLTTIMVPVAVYSIEALAGHHVDDQFGFLLMMLAAVAFGLPLAAKTRIAFVSAPALVAGALAAETAGDLLLQGQWFSHAALLLAAYGAVVSVASFVLDRRSSEDYSWWGYLIGGVSLFVGLTLADKGEVAYMLYAGAGVVSMLTSVLLSRRVFAFIGALSVLIWTGHLMFDIFHDSTAFALALTVLGLATVYFGVWYHRHAEQIEKAVLALIPDGLKRLLPSER